MPRPKIEGTVRRVIDMHHSSLGKNKDYRITVSEFAPGQHHVYTEYGPANKLQNGKRVNSASLTWAEAQAKADEIRNEKQTQSDAYVVTSDRTVQPTSGSAPAPAKAAKPAAKTKRPVVKAAKLSAASRAALNMIF